MDNDEVAELAGEFADLGAQLHGDGDNRSALQRMVQLAAKHVPGCVWASVTSIEGKNAATIAASDDVACTADQIQYSTGEGPCLSAAHDGQTYMMFDIARNTRWPRFAAALAEQTPVRSVLSFQLAAKESAALNLYGENAGAFDDDSVLIGTVLAAHVSSTVALHQAGQRADQLQTALESSRDIGAAIGVLMSHHKVTREAAFDLLRTASQHLNRKPAPQPQTPRRGRPGRRRRRTPGSPTRTPASPRELTAARLPAHGAPGAAARSRGEQDDGRIAADPQTSSDRGGVSS